MLLIPADEGPTFTGRVVYGIKGIEDLFSISHRKAQEWKDSWLQPAVRQYGRKIITDVAYAMKLYDKLSKTGTPGKKGR